MFRGPTLKALIRYHLELSWGGLKNFADFDLFFFPARFLALLAGLLTSALPLLALESCTFCFGASDFFGGNLDLVSNANFPDEQEFPAVIAFLGVLTDFSTVLEVGILLITIP